ncbi:cation diffusion facilitator family transporter [Paenibacillus sp. MER 180]|uniref:Cation diffusion facilitator family transporter n=1 Tax=Paenibacillus alvei TaxID=44250 RepID=A0ABT4EAE7_PAEAL|nr:MULTISPECIES: cation diffusion facilitator family transporter [Paenibacillus]EPY10545.1 cobalt-zinc-cadmium resistance protein CzcD [Paenibacillus alvei A6-6i-x]MCM3289048.1 cation diffusion facilitator family transporter [Paenibacillus sp. MER 180]MCY9530702.1 cation diffusion facilitator family transporter [Paenibacillus alvei]SDF14709.1 cation diffusion facilitator family transporter [Paenibacillus sp. cl6col]
MSTDRFAKAETGAWVGIIGNILLAGVKGIAGFLSGSQALIADAFHSASDVAGSFAVLVGLKAAKRPPDKDHPYGHGKAESIAAIVVSVLLLVVGIELAISAAKSIWNGKVVVPEWYALAAIILSIVAKESMFQYKFRLGKRLSSQALIANAWEHRSDVYSSIAALAGVGGAMIGGKLGISWLLYLDPIAGAVVALLVLRMGYRLVLDSIHSTMDHVLHDEDANPLIRAVQSVDGVITVDELRAREHGHYVIVDVKISVNPRLTVAEGHTVAKRVKKHLLQRFIHVADVFVHVNPFDPGFPYRSQEARSEDASTLLQ